MILVYILAGILGFLIFIVFPWATYNSLAKKKIAIENNASQIGIQCKKRFDLVPNLVETVKGYAKHEHDTLQDVIAARNAGANATNLKDLAAANNQITGALGRLFALSESYPDLKANAGFVSLQGELANLERQIATSRQLFNDSVMIYNRTVAVFPKNIIAKMFGFKKSEFFATPTEEMQNVKVNFGG